LNGPFPGGYSIKNLPMKGLFLFTLFLPFSLFAQQRSNVSIQQGNVLNNRSSTSNQSVVQVNYFNVQSNNFNQSSNVRLNTNLNAGLQVRTNTNPQQRANSVNPVSGNTAPRQTTPPYQQQQFQSNPARQNEVQSVQLVIIDNIQDNNVNIEIGNQLNAEPQILIENIDNIPEQEVQNEILVEETQQKNVEISLETKSNNKEKSSVQPEVFSTDFGSADLDLNLSFNKKEKKAKPTSVKRKKVAHYSQSAGRVKAKSKKKKKTKSNCKTKGGMLPCVQL